MNSKPNSKCLAPFCDLHSLFSAILYRIPMFHLALKLRCIDSLGIVNGCIDSTRLVNKCTECTRIINGCINSTNEVNDKDSLNFSVFFRHSVKFNFGAFFY